MGMIFYLLILKRSTEFFSRYFFFYWSFGSAPFRIVLEKIKKQVVVIDATTNKCYHCRINYYNEKIKDKVKK